ncbi:MAG TPA: DNA cytosine methyltransferase [Candidatus Dormibacteraeota bacterium]|jgi:DNA (cytosine-5)-methyltransferase 1
MTLTISDYFCGGGGSTSGFHELAKLMARFFDCRVVMAANHWNLAIETHNANFPDTDHDMADIASIDPRRHPTTDIAWFSPECTNWSVAKGVKQNYDGKPVQLALGEEYEEPLPDEAAQRSRMLMQDVPRFTEVHHYRAVIVENVTDVLKWEHLDKWLARMTNMGYRHRIAVLNSAFASALGDGAPQLRDRVYFVFWRSEYKEPDFQKWTRPLAYCPTCDTDVRAMYVAKPGPRRAMRYGSQYSYRCPSVWCRGASVQPYALPAAAAIDWTIEGQRIGDRVRPLQPKTLARIEAGLRKYTRPVTLEAAGNTFERRPGVRSWPVDEPLKTLHTTASKALACPPMLVPSGGTWNESAQPVTMPMRARTTRETEAVVVPMLVPVEGRDGKQVRLASAPMRAQTARLQDALVVPLRNNGVARPATESPLPTFAANGTHHGLLNMPGLDPYALLPYDGKSLRSLGMPMPAQTTVQGDALVGTSFEVENCTFRMLEVEEIRDGMDFPADYILLGTKRERVRLLGNAVTPCAARDLGAAVIEAITGIELELAA